MKVIYDDYYFDVDIEETKEFYSNYEHSNKDIVYENFIQNIDTLKELMEFLEIFGIEPRNPVEVNSYGNSKGIIDYELVYVVCGEIISHPSYEISVGKSNIAYYTSANAIEFTNKALYKELADPIIIFDVFEVCVPWTMKIDYDIVHPKITKKSFVKRVVKKISKKK